MDRGRGRGGYARGSGRGQDFREDRGRGGGNPGRGRGDFQGGRGGRGGGPRYDTRAKVPVIPNDRKLQLITNMYPVKISVKIQEVFKRYDVGFFTITGAVKSIPSKRLRRMVVGELSKLIKAPFAYDGMSTLFSYGELPSLPDLKPGPEFYSEKKPELSSSSSREATLTILASSSSRSSEGKGEIEDIEEQLVRTKLETTVMIPKKGEAIAKFDAKALHYVITLPDEKRKEGRPNSGKIVVQLKITDATWNDETVAQLLGIATQYSCYRQREDSIIRENTVFSALQAKPLSNNKLESDLLLFTGIFQSYRRTNFGVVFNVDVSFFIALGAYSLVDWFGIRARNMGYRSLGEAFNNASFKEKINKELRGMEVRVSYGVRRKYKLEGIDMKFTPKSATFVVPELNDAKVSLLEYMKKKYNVIIKNDTLPLLLVKPKAKKSPTDVPTPTWLVAELCAFTEGQKRRSILTAEERALMIERTRTEPLERFQVIDGLVKDVVTNEYFKQFPIEVDSTHPYTVTSNVMNQMQLEFNNRATLKPDEKGSWNFRGFNFKIPAKGTLPWALIFPPFADERIGEFIDLFTEVARNTGMSISDTPLEIRTQGERTDHYEKAALSISSAKTQPKFILCLLADSNAERHDVIKKICDLKLLIPSKCMKYDDKTSFKAGVLANVLASINVKLGGYNWNVLSKITPPKIQNSVLCIMGLDVCHGNTSEIASSGSGSGSSTVALCASLNETFTKYHTAIGYQDARREVVLDIYKMVIEVLTAFAKRNNGLLPTDVLFYRDGVGEGMYSDVQSFEIAQTKKAFGEICKAANRPNPRLTYLIVQKRNHFRSKVVQNGEVFNPPHGTAVNAGITDKDTKNFYLYSHHALQGTAKPTHYQIIEDGCGYGEKLEEVTYALAHLHQGCPKTISIPVPVFYADGAAGRIADYYDGTPKVPVNIQDGFTV